MEAVFKRGNPVFSDYTPSGADIEAGAVVVVGVTPRVAHRKIEDGQFGSLAVRGGVYTFAKTAGSALTDGAKVYWDDTNNVATTTATSNQVLGWVVDGGAASAATEVAVLHEPGA